MVLISHWLLLQMCAKNTGFLHRPLLKSGALVYLIQSCRHCPSRPYFWRHSQQLFLRKTTLKSATKLKFKTIFLLGLIPVGSCFVCGCLINTLPWNILKLFPSLTIAQSQSAVDIISPQAQNEQSAVKQQFSKYLNFVTESFLLFVHWLKLCILFGPLLILYPVTFICSSIYSFWLKAFFHTVQFAGPVYIKLGQWASTRRDLFSAEFCEIFSQLHYNVQPHEWRHTEGALCKAYGKKWFKVLKIDKTQKPLGSGCVAQVYKGYIHKKNLPEKTLEALEGKDELDDLYFKDGLEIHSLMDSFSHSEELEEASVVRDNSYPVNDELFATDPNYVAVAIKVLHPNVRERLSRDLTLISWFAGFLEIVIPSLHWVNLTQCVHEFSVSMMKQMDMIHEARSLKKFQTNFADMPSIRIPVPIMFLVRRNVLVESFEHGRLVGELLREKENLSQDLREKIADIGVDALLQMVFTKNFVHGDLHPGNILVQNAEDFEEQTDDSILMVDIGDVVVTTVTHNTHPLRLVLLDCGITASLTEDDLDKLKQVFLAVVKGQGEVVADLFLEKSRHVECTDPEAFRQDMARIVNKARETTLQLSKFKVSVLMIELFSVLSRHRVKLEANFATIIMAIVVLEGLGRSLDPNLDILKKTSAVLLGEMVHK